MDRQLLILVLFIGVNVPHSSCMSNQQHNAISTVSPTAETFRKRRLENTTFCLINPKQLDVAERVIEKFLFKTIGPISKDFTLKLRLSGSSQNTDKLTQTVCTAIRKKLMEFAQQCGLKETFEHYKKSLFRAVNDSTGDWYSEGILHGSLLLSDVLRMVDEGSSLINKLIYQQNTSMIVPSNHTESPGDSIEFQLFERLNSLMDYVSRLPQCINTSSGSAANENRRIFFTNLLRNLTADSPERIIHNLKIRFYQSTFPKVSSTSSDNERFRAIFCSFAVQQGIIEYMKCVDEVNRINECIFKTENETDQIHAHRLAVAPWLKALKSLGYCRTAIDKTRRQLIIYCHLNISSKRLSTKQKLRYIYGVLQLRNVRGKWITHVASDLGDALSRSQIGNEIVNELHQLCRIYRDAQNKVNRLGRLAGKNRNYYIRYRKVLNAFEEYKRGLLLETLLSIRQVHDSMYAFNDFMMHIDPMLFSNWKSYMGVLRSAAEWIDCLLALIGITVSDTEDVIESDPEEYEDEKKFDTDNGFWEPNQNASDLFYAANIERKKNLRKAADTAFGKLLRTMRNANNVEIVNTRSTLTTIANNILLATMFIETVGLISSLFSYQSMATENEIMPISGPAEADADQDEDDIGFDDYDL